MGGGRRALRRWRRALMRGAEGDVGINFVDVFNRCPAGCFFSNLTCSQCAAGSYNCLSGQSSCSPCPAGASNPSLGRASCSPCANGTYSGLGQSSCSDCPSGSYCPDPARSPVICPAARTAKPRASLLPHVFLEATVDPANQAAATAPQAHTALINAEVL